jgi:hypothetical protein
VTKLKSSDTHTCLSWSVGLAGLIGRIARVARRDGRNGGKEGERLNFLPHGVQAIVDATKDLPDVSPTHDRRVKTQNRGTHSPRLHDPSLFSRYVVYLHCTSITREV